LTQSSTPPHVVATIEARMTSSRLPGKMAMTAVGRPMLALLVERLKRVPGLHDIVLATTTNSTDDVLAGIALHTGIQCSRGSEDDVLGRVLGAAQAHQADVIVEITGDCAALDPHIVQECLDVYLTGQYDFVANCIELSYPVGMDARIFSTETLAEVDRLGQSPADREHVSSYIWEHPDRFRIHHVKAPPELTWPDLWLALDYPEDYEFIKAIFEALYPTHSNFTLRDIIALLHARPELLAINAHLQR
jgi:spore coat polysaccharide biosynthesis protein SpsF